MALRLTKTSKIVFAVFILLLSVALGFLIWRVNQEETVAPEDTEAAYSCSWGSDCTVEDWGVKCYWPQTAYCNRDYQCVCMDVATQRQDPEWNPCMDLDPQCTPDCGEGRQKCGEYGAGCGDISECSTVCASCNNPYSYRIECAPIDWGENQCDGGSWVTRPTGSIEYETDISFRARAEDSDGIDNSSITARLCTGSLSECTAGVPISYSIVETGPTYTIFGGTLSTQAGRLNPGTYTFTVAWEDNLGVTGPECILTTVFTVLPQETNPDWSLQKAVVGECIDEGTEDPKGRLSYTITVRNTGDGTGSISKLEDALDAKVVTAGIQPTGITTPGTYSNGKILWDYPSGLSFTPGQQRLYVYGLLISKEYFGTYNNIVTLTIGEDTLQATATIDITCDILVPEEPPEEPEIPEIPEIPEEGTVPETGIFDSTLGRIATGMILVLLGAVVYNVPNSVFRVKKKEMSYKYRDRFEKKVDNK